MGAQDGHLDFHTASELCPLSLPDAGGISTASRSAPAPCGQPECVCGWAGFKTVFTGLGYTRVASLGMPG